ncbi:MAG: hypothetical protein GWM90_18065, partial [Gemmatimonadetes bacterium]|nr:hypothetical protein [Gemmatimonadota bacterium]NIQ56925.1 hypothetical protein [Gemmatimonadota bacterium]NIU77099.1 hypothetical protein [Gammaproteobacteria bacterium]NIX45928.1 hypothetical protein [Gemmatimonadota bacterium]NIY10249.1 hypothetical protein [Gemmatimonadota bacterium]
MKRTLPFLAILAVACSPSTPGAGGPDAGALMAAASTITAAELRDRIAFLASDELRGRDTPSPGLDSAAHWVATQLAGAGLRPAGEDGWFQWYPYPARALDEGEMRLEVSAGATHAFEYGRDFFASAGTSPERPVEAVWIGDGVPDAGAVRDRAVIARLDGLPEAGSRGLRFSRVTERAARELVDRAVAAGAAAVLFVMDARLTVGEVGALAEAAEAPRRALGGTAGPDVGLARFYLTRVAAGRVLRMAGLEVDGLAGDGAPVVLPGVTLRLAAPTRGVDEAR